MDIKEHIKRVFATRSNGIFFEIGAHWGIDTISILNDVGDKISRYVAFEPDPRNIGVFKKNVTHPAVTLVEMAVADKNGSCDFHLSSGRPKDVVDPAYNHTHSSSIRKPKLHLQAHPWCKFESKITVPVTTLDTYCLHHDIKHIDFIWADMQGAECDMIRGGQHMLTNTDYVYMEHNERELYDGAMPSDKLLALLPGKWEIVERYSHDILVHSMRT